MAAEALTRDRVRRIYDRIGSLQDTQAFYEDRAVDDLIAAGSFESASAVFELGCGTGRLGARLLGGPLPAGATYRGVDLSPKMVRLARRRLARFGARAGVDLTDGDLPLPAADGTHDRWLCCFVLDLLPYAEIDAVLRDAHRILRPGGLLGLAALSSGTGPVSRTVARTWAALHRFRPALTAACRPIELAARLPDTDWRLEHHARLAPFGMPLEVVVARRIAPARAGPSS